MNDADRIEHDTDAKSPLPEPPARLPKGWTRTYAPEYSCGAYTLYRDERTRRDGSWRDPYDIEVCRLGISIHYLDHVHLSPADWNALMGAVHADFVSFRESARTAGMCDCRNLCAATCPVHRTFDGELREESAAECER